MREAGELDTYAALLSLSETPFRLRRWPLSDADPVVRCLRDAVFDVPLARCAGVGAHRSPAPDRRPQAVCQKTAEVDCRRPSVLGFPLAGLGRLALSAGHRQTRDRDRLASQGISPFLELEDPAWPRGSARRFPRDPRSDPQDEPRKPAVGRPPYPRGIAETGHRDQ